MHTLKMYGFKALIKSSTKRKKIIYIRTFEMNNDYILYYLDQHTHLIVLSSLLQCLSLYSVTVLNSRCYGDISYPLILTSFIHICVTCQFSSTQLIEFHKNQETRFVPTLIHRHIYFFG